MNNLSELTEAFLEHIHDTCLRFNYSEFDGMKTPTLAEMYQLRGLIEGVIEEMRSSKDCSS